MMSKPPECAEALLRILLDPGHVDSVSGDLLEEYRDSILPARGQRGADRWYLTQVLGFVWRGARVWALVFGGAFVARTALDWFVPPESFYERATASTALSALLLLSAGSWAAWRSGSFLAGTVIGGATAALGALVSIAGGLSLLAVRHDPATLLAIQQSGGFGEVMTLPVLLIMPGLVLGTAGGLVSGAFRRLRRA